MLPTGGSLILAYQIFVFQVVIRLITRCLNKWFTLYYLHIHFLQFDISFTIFHWLNSSTMSILQWFEIQQGSFINDGPSLQQHRNKKIPSAKAQALLGKLVCPSLARLLHCLQSCHQGPPSEPIHWGWARPRSGTQ